VLLALACPVAAHALVIDDFEQGPFLVVDDDPGPGGRLLFQSGLPGANVFGGSRETFAGNEAGGVGIGSTADLSLPALDGAVLFSGSSSAFRLTYDGFGSLDLLSGGFDAVLVEQQVGVSASARTGVALVDASSRRGELFRINSDPQALFAFNDFSFDVGFDVTAVTQIVVTLELPEAFSSAEQWGFQAIRMIPEPGSGVLAALGLAALCLARVKSRSTRPGSLRRCAPPACGRDSPPA
jgi:hypothetical protein